MCNHQTDLSQALPGLLNEDTGKVLKLTLYIRRPQQRRRRGARAHANARSPPRNGIFEERVCRPHLFLAAAVPTDRGQCGLSGDGSINPPNA